MPKVKLLAFSISLDGFGAGVDQDLNHPLGIGGEEAFKWMFVTKKFAEMTGQTGGSEGVDNRFAEQSFDNIGSWIMGRNMFGPIRGDWPDNEWKGWWGEDPPFHTPVFVLTHHPRKSIEMKGGTVFHFVTDGIDSALKQATTAANGKDIRIGGGVSTFRQFLQADYLDEIHLALAPVFLGSGEHMFAGIHMPGFGFNRFQKTEGENATHFVITKG